MDVFKDAEASRELLINAEEVLGFSRVDMARLVTGEKNGYNKYRQYVTEGKSLKRPSSPVIMYVYTLLAWHKQDKHAFLAYAHSAIADAMERG